MISDLTCLLKQIPENNLRDEITYINKMVTYVGIKLDHYNISDNLAPLIILAYEMSHFEIIQEILNTNFVLQPNTITLVNDIDKKDINEFLCSKYSWCKMPSKTTRVISML
jgi:hypothetical protein